MSPPDDELELEMYLDYFGDAEHVKKSLHECLHCGTKLTLGHNSDYRNLLIQEQTQCLVCHKSRKKIIHKLH